MMKSARVKREKSAALLKIFGSEGITDQSDRIKAVARDGLFPWERVDMAETLRNAFGLNGRG